MEEQNPIEDNQSSIGSLSLDRSDSNSNHGDSTIVEEAQFWQEDPIEENLDPNFGNTRGEPEGDGPPPYPGNAQGNAQGAAAQIGQQDNLIQMIQGIILAQQNQVEAHQAQNQAQMEANRRFQEAHNALGNDIRNLAQVVENMNQNRPHGGRPQQHPLQTFKPSMFRSLDMKALNKDNKLLSEEFVNWKLSILRVLRANPGANNLPIDQLTALILASIGEKAERRLTGLGQNPTFNSLDEFFDKLQSIFCSSTVKSEAENQFHTAKQYPNEDLNGWHARCLLYFRLAFPTQDYWNILLKKFFGGMSNRKLARKTCENIFQRPGGWEALLSLEGYELCLSLTIRDEASSGFMSSFLGDKTSSFKTYEKTETSVPMDTSSVQNRTNFRGHRSARNTTANVNPQGKPNSNPPAGAQKKLQQQARTQRKQSQPLDMSKIKCFKCDNVGHWARDCTARAKGPANSTVTTILPDTKDWGDVSIVSSVVSSIPEEPQNGQDNSKTISSWADESTNTSRPN